LTHTVHTYIHTYIQRGALEIIYHAASRVVKYHNRRIIQQLLRIQQTQKKSPNRFLISKTAKDRATRADATARRDDPTRWVSRRSLATAKKARIYHRSMVRCKRHVEMLNSLGVRIDCRQY